MGKHKIARALGVGSGTVARIKAGSFTASEIKALRWQLDLNPCTDAQGIFWRLATRATAILGIPDRAKGSRAEHDHPPRSDGELPNRPGSACACERR